jgi:hypothetical protein
MHFDDALRDRQAKTCATLLPGAAVVDLLEFFEDESLVLGRDAGTGVSDGDLEVPVDRIGKNVDCTRFGEFDGIACKIEQDLRQTAFVPAADWKVLGNSR